MMKNFLIIVLFILGLYYVSTVKCKEGFTGEPIPFRCPNVLIQHNTMITDLISRITFVLSQCPNVCIRRIPMITDVFLRIVCFLSQRSTFQRPRKLPEAMRKLVGSFFLWTGLQ